MLNANIIKIAQKYNYASKLIKQNKSKQENKK